MRGYFLFTTALNGPNFSSKLKKIGAKKYFKGCDMGFQMSTHARIVIAKGMSRPEQSQYSTIVMLMYKSSTVL